MSRSTSFSSSSESPDQVEIDGLSAYFRNLNASLSGYCLSLQIKSFYNFKATNTIPPLTSTIRDGNFTFTIPPQYSATISPPCCGQCYIQADEAHVVYWPTPAPQPNISTIVGANDFTL